MRPPVVPTSPRKVSTHDMQTSQYNHQLFGLPLFSCRGLWVWRANSFSTWSRKFYQRCSIMIYDFSISQILQILHLNFMLLHCVATYTPEVYAIYEFPARTTNKTCLKIYAQAQQIQKKIAKFWKASFQTNVCKRWFIWKTLAVTVHAPCC